MEWLYLLVRLGLVSDADVAQALSAQLGIALVPADGFPDLMPEVEGLLPEFLHANAVYPLRLQDGRSQLLRRGERENLQGLLYWSLGGFRAGGRRRRERSGQQELYRRSLSKDIFPSQRGKRLTIRLQYPILCMGGCMLLYIGNLKRRNK